MVLSRTDENELLTALHAGVFQEAPWRLFLSRLRARAEADLCRLFIRPAGDMGWREADAVRDRNAAATDFDAPDFDALRPGRVYAGEELGAGKSGARHIRVSWPDGGEMALSLHRAKGDFRARDSAMLASLAPHLTIALRAHIEVDGARRRSALDEAVLRDFAAAWVLLDARGRVLDADPAATRLIEEGRVMRRASDGRLRCPYGEGEALIEQAVADPPDMPRAAWLCVDPPMQMVAMRPAERTAFTLAQPRCVLLIRGIREEALGGGRYLTDLFRLTRSEAALAVRIAEGDSLAEAAEALGLTIETARNYSKRVYLKTGARGQGDLVRILLNGIGMLG
jgi:DNA-binding CsgD family transcriptional regulator